MVGDSGASTFTTSKTNIMSKQIRTEIVINASAERVWQVLTDFNAYPSWNPFLVSIEGGTAVGGRLTNTMLNGDKKYVFRPTVTRSEPNRHFAWLGSLFFKGLFDGNHFFEIKQLSGSQVMLVHGENFSGILSGWLLKKIGADTRLSFIKMNEALKAVAER